MATVDLTTPPPPPTGLLDALPRRVSLTLPELRLAASLAGDAPLPFELAEPADLDLGHAQEQQALGDVAGCAGALGQEPAGGVVALQVAVDPAAAVQEDVDAVGL